MADKKHQQLVDKMMKNLSRQLAALRAERQMSALGLSKLAAVDRATLGALEAGCGNITSLQAIANALGHGVSPLPSALANKRRWRGIGTRALAQAAGLSRPTVQTMERTGQGRVTSFEVLCTALDEPAVLRRLEETWWTPAELIKAIMSGLDIECFDLDPASPNPPTVPCRSHYTERDGGLWLPWHGVTFVNPPYDDVPRWLAKAVEEFEAGRAACIVGLVPYRPETNAWKVLVRSEADIFVLEDRLRFGGRSYVSPSVSAVVVWGADPETLTGLSNRLPRHHRVVLVKQQLAQTWHCRRVDGLVG